MFNTSNSRIAALIVAAVGSGCNSAPHPAHLDAESSRCSDPRPEVCTSHYDPVCGIDEDGSRRTYGNACNACADPAIVRHMPGECR